MAASAQAVSGLINSASKQQLEQIRRNIYKMHVPTYNLMRSESGKVLHPANPAMRLSNFKKFVELYFYKVDHSNNRDEFHSDYGLSTKLTETSGGYIAFKKFAMTDYGSYGIKMMIDNPNTYKGFQVWENAIKGAFGDYNFISLPKGFSLSEARFSSSNQRVHFLAILYHELAHTMMFRKPESKNIDIDIYDERIAVMKYENPIRLRDNYEPGYTYTKADDSKPDEDKTINIITKDVRVGKWSVKKDDPRVFAKIGDKDSMA